MPTIASSCQEDQIQEQTSSCAGGAAKSDTTPGDMILTMSCGDMHPFMPSYSNNSCTNIGNFADRTVTHLKVSSNFVPESTGMIKNDACTTITTVTTFSTEEEKSSCYIERGTEVTPLLDNSEVWDESIDMELWQGGFLNQQKCLLPNDLSKLNSVFD